MLACAEDVFLARAVRYCIDANIICPNPGSDSGSERDDLRGVAASDAKVLIAQRGRPANLVDGNHYHSQNKLFARLIRDNCRPGDFVALSGGRILPVHGQAIDDLNIEVSLDRKSVV